MSSDTQQNETSFQVDNLTTDAPPIYTEAAHWSISGQALDTQRKHQQDPPPAYKSGQQAVDSVQQSGSLQQAGNVNSPLSTKEREEVVIVPLPQPVRLNIATEQPQPQLRPRSVAHPVRPTVWLSRYDVKNRVQRRLCCVLLCTVLLAFFGTPLTLFVTIPSLYCACKAKTYLEENQLDKANSKSGVATFCTIVLTFTVLMLIFCVIPIAIVLAL